MSGWQAKLVAGATLAGLVLALAWPVWSGLAALQDNWNRGAIARADIDRLELALTAVQARRDAALTARGWTERALDVRRSATDAGAHHVRVVETVLAALDEAGITRLSTAPTEDVPLSALAGVLETRLDFVAEPENVLPVLAAPTFGEAEVSYFEALTLGDGSLRISMTLSTSYLTGADDGV